MTEDQEKLLARAREALVEINHGNTDNAAGVVHDLIREIRRLQDIIDAAA